MVKVAAANSSSVDRKTSQIGQCKSLAKRKVSDSKNDKQASTREGQAALLEETIAGLLQDFDDDVDTLLVHNAYKQHKKRVTEWESFDNDGFWSDLSTIAGIDEDFFLVTWICNNSDLSVA